jgi:hypothetical protein
VFVRLATKLDLDCNGQGQLREPVRELIQEAQGQEAAAAWFYIRSVVQPG